MREFAAQVRTRIAALPPHQARATLLRDADALQTAITQRASPEDVGRRARLLGTAVLAAYPTALAPNRAPDLDRAAALYQERCGSCHGVTGGADGPAARGLDPPPIAFTDVERARQRSVFGLYQVISQGLEGTAMTSFSDLPSEERWGLALYVGQFAFSPERAREGERLWREDQSVRAHIPNLQALAPELHIQ